MTQDTTHALIRTALDRGALKLGDFTLKSGRPSPYFFNLAQMDTGSALAALAKAYANARMPMEFDMLFGPAYKGIPLVAVVAVELAARGRDVPYAYNRKEAKTHGEGGTLVGAPVRGHVALLDDVLTAGTAMRQVIELITAAGAAPCAAVVALDRLETVAGGAQDQTALAALGDTFGLTTASLFTARDIAAYVSQDNPSASTVIETHLSEHGC